MKILICAHNLRKGGGIPVAQNLILEICLQMPQAEVLVTVPSNCGYETILNGNENCRLILSKHKNVVVRQFFDKVVLHKICRCFEPDVFIGLGNMTFGLQAKHTVLMLHNPYYVYPRKNWGSGNPLSRQLLIKLQRFIFQRDLRKTDLVILQTKTMEKRLHSAYQYSGRTLIIPNAHHIQDEQFLLSRSQKLDEILAKGKKILFCLSAYYPHKNLELFLKLFVERGHELGDFIVVITVDSENDHLAKTFLEKVASLNLSSSIVNVGPLERHELAAFYKASYAVVLPTLLESFSGVYVEAMSYKVAIVTTDLDFAREVCGDCALYFQQENFSDMFEKILLVDSQRDVMQDNCEKQIERVSGTWLDFAGNLISEIKSLRENKIVTT